MIFNNKFVLDIDFIIEGINYVNIFKRHIWLANSY